MASGNVDYSDYRTIAPPYDEPPRQRGCFFYGCIIAVVLTVLLLVAVGVILVVLYRLAGRMVEEYTATAPRELPRVEVPLERRQTVKEREQAFRKAIGEDQPTGPLVLSSEELNVLIEDKPDLKGRVHVVIDHDKLKGQVSIPLNEFPSMGLTRGRYLIGEVEFNVWVKDGLLYVTISSIEVNGKRPSDEFLVQLRGVNWADAVNDDVEKSQEIGKLESVEVKDGKLIITPRNRKNAPALQPLPDDVLAPPEPAAKP